MKNLPREVFILGELAEELCSVGVKRRKLAKLYEAIKQTRRTESEACKKQIEAMENYADALAKRIELITSRIRLGDFMEEE